MEWVKIEDGLPQEGVMVVFKCEDTTFTVYNMIAYNYVIGYNCCKKGLVKQNGESLASGKPIEYLILPASLESKE